MLISSLLLGGSFISSLINFVYSATTNSIKQQEEQTLFRIKRSTSSFSKEEGLKKTYDNIKNYATIYKTWLTTHNHGLIDNSARIKIDIWALKPLPILIKDSEGNVRRLYDMSQTADNKPIASQIDDKGLFHNINLVTTVNFDQYNLPEIEILELVKSVTQPRDYDTSFGWFAYWYGGTITFRSDEKIRIWGTKDQVNEYLGKMQKHSDDIWSEITYFQRAANTDHSKV